MMRIAYVSRLGLDRERGVLKKVVSQVRTWLANGEEVKLFTLSGTGKIWDEIADLPIEVVLSGTKLMPLLRAHTLIKRVIAWQPDVAYVRWGPNYPSLPILMKNVPTLMEINTDDLAEFRVLLPWIKYLYHRATRNRVLGGAAGFVCMTHELAERFRKYGKPMIVVANGINLREYPQIPPTGNSNPRLVLIANMQKDMQGIDWHGIDKVLWLARHFAKWQFDLIGIEARQIDHQGCGVPPNVATHGVLGRTDYEKILLGVDIGLGTLALHRKNMDEACPLKVREYLAYGIPTIIGYRDTDFPQPVPFLLQIPNTATNVIEHVSDIQQFVETWKAKRMRRECTSHLDMQEKEKKRITFFRQFLQI
jgi:hypothetical protein